MDKPAKSNDKEMEEVNDPDAEKILEDEDWMVNEDSYDNNYEEDDLMEDDDLLVDDMEQEETSITVADQNPIDALRNLDEGNKALESLSPTTIPDRRPETRPAQTPSSRSRPSPAKKKKGSPSPIATGVSLRQRNLLAGRTSTKTKSARSGLKADDLPQARDQVPSDIVKAEAKGGKQ
ncbi:origin recognition complex subunit 1-like [Raphanus sativus]|nr:origin recognition complex subunit 1-like [Raphanus sativus]